MPTLYLCHPAALDHETPLGHPERPDRIRVVERALEDERFMTLVREQAPCAEHETIALVHPRRYVDALVQASPREGLVAIDSDTVLSPGTLEAALRSAGAAVQAVDEVMAGTVTNAFAAMRPPGHHAERAQAMGFCFFNNAAIAARRAQAQHGAERVAIIDWDVHHGNGTQDIFWEDGSVLYASTHEMPLYPGTGALSERGEHDTIVNAPLSAGDGSDVFREALETRVLPRIDAFRPDLIVISAGFDAHWRDPLGNVMLTEADFQWATLKLMDIAERHAKGRVVSLLEGGYDLEGLARSVAAHVQALMGQA
ncbi:histone deacetylase family protein [Salinarimonas rosea]|uniref:histone deacetylase family protein n=1 Tax=Salinarimonas rosea TaxID=552063 RepID=UPI000425F3ED|nr:histone deacetylase family protein [Salinarimonas rosea]